MLSQSPVTVIGAGISGAACARGLHDSGVAVRLIDRGHRVGGRMGSRRLDARPVDLGASYFTVTDDAFDAQVQDWRERGLARAWTDRFTVLDLDGAQIRAELKQGPLRWGAPGGLRTLVEDLSTGPGVEQRTVEHVDRAADGTLSVDGEPAAAVVLAMPDPQAVRLLGPGLGDIAARLDRAFEPVIALAAWWPARTWDDVSPDGTFHGAFVNGDDALAWVADDGRRRGDDAACLVAHSTPGFARAHLDEPDRAAPPLLAALRRALGLPEPTGAHVHRWSLAKPSGERDADHLLSRPDEGAPLGVCGDGWGPSSKVETAWLSGRALARELIRRRAEPATR